MRPLLVFAGALVWRARLPLFIFVVEFVVACGEWVERRHQERAR